MLRSCLTLRSLKTNHKHIPIECKPFDFYPDAVTVNDCPEARLCRIEHFRPYIRKNQGHCQIVCRRGSRTGRGAEILYTYRCKIEQRHSVIRSGQFWRHSPASPPALPDPSTQPSLATVQENSGKADDSLRKWIAMGCCYPVRLIHQFGLGMVPTYFAAALFFAVDRDFDARSAHLFITGALPFLKIYSSAQHFCGW